MSNRVMWSIGLLVSAAVSILFIFPNSIIGWGIGSIFILIFLLIWAFSDPYGRTRGGQTTVRKGNDPLLQRLRKGVLSSGAGILVALFVSFALVVVLPPDYVSWVLLGIGLLIGLFWFVNR